MSQPIIIGSLPGIVRDTTVFDGDAYSDGVWCRFYRKKPRKIGGWSLRSQQVSGICRGMGISELNGLSYVHCGSQNVLERFTLDNVTGVASSALDRTPVGFAADPNNTWQFSAMYDGGGNASYLLAHAAPNLSDIASAVDRPIYFGDNYGAGALTAITGSDVSGGIVALYPYLFALGNDGLVKWSVANTPTDFVGAGSGAARICGSKVIVGWPMRAGAGVAPAGLFWAVDTLVRVTFVGGTAIWNFDTVNDDITVIAPGSVVEYGNVYYWLGIDQFYQYNGVVSELPNEMNLSFFYDTLKPGTSGKIYAFKVPRWGELWWCYVSTIVDEFHTQWDEPNHAIIYNMRDKVWYDTPLPANGRSYGHYVQAYPYPIMTGGTVDMLGKSGLYQHEIGFDASEGSTPLAIRSYFETANISLLPPTGTADKSISISRVEPDFIQQGIMTAQVRGRANARAADADSSVQDIVATPLQPYQQIVTFKNANFRQVRFRFESNTLGGMYQMGKMLASIDPTDGTVLGAVG